jgi:tetratricopeptide (TPR) repeat protein
VVAAALFASGWASGCVYYNGLYNAETAFRRGEEARLGGDAVTALLAYAEAAEGATRAWRSEPEGRWAAPALLLAARAAVRTDDPRRARAELDRLAMLPALDSVSRERALVLRGAVLAVEHRPQHAVEMLDAARLAPGDTEWRAESWLWKARALAALDRFDEAWAAWDFAAVHDTDLRWVVEAERSAEAVRADRPGEASVALRHLLERRRGQAWVDSVLVVADRAERRWGPSVAAELIEPVRRDRWGPAARDRVMLRRVDLLLAARDTSRADEALAWIAEGTTETAVTARIRLARVRLAGARGFADLVRIRRLLLPVADDSRARDLLLAMVETELLSGWGVDGDVLAWFSAGEVARDRLGAGDLAGALFLTAAESDPEGRWTGKSLLASLTVLGEAGLRERIRARALGRELDPWVERLTPGYLASDEFQRREAELAERVRELRLRASGEAERLTTATDPVLP